MTQAPETQLELHADSKMVHVADERTTGQTDAGPLFSTPAAPERIAGLVDQVSELTGSQTLNQKEAASSQNLLLFLTSGVSDFGSAGAERQSKVSVSETSVKNTNQSNQSNH